MLDHLSVPKLVTGRLDAVGIGYMMTGSIAAGHYGQHRMTRDIDVVAQSNPRDADRLVAMLGEEFTGDADTIPSDNAHRSMFNVIHDEALTTVDFVVLKDAPHRIEEFGRRRIVEVDGHPVWIVSPEDLVLSKLDGVCRSMPYGE